MNQFDFHDLSVYVSEIGRDLGVGQSITITFARSADEPIKLRPYIRVYAVDHQRRLVEINSASTSVAKEVDLLEHTMRLPIPLWKPLTDSPLPGNGIGVVTQANFTVLYDVVRTGVDLLWTFVDLTEEFRPFVYELGFINFSLLPLGVNVRSDGSFSWSSSNSLFALVLQRCVSYISRGLFMVRARKSRNPLPLEKEVAEVHLRDSALESWTFWALHDHTLSQIGLVRTSNRPGQANAEVLFDRGWVRVPRTAFNFEVKRYAPKLDFGNQATPCPTFAAHFAAGNQDERGNTYEQ